MKKKINWKSVYNVILKFGGLWLIMDGILIACNYVPYNKITDVIVYICFGICAFCFKVVEE